MNKNTIVVATTLATAIAFGGFIDSADAQVRRARPGNRYSPTSFNEAGVIAQFTLFDTTENGQPILDQDIDSQGGLFVGAIEEFATATGTVCSRTFSGTKDEAVCKNLSNSSTINDSTAYFYDSSGFPVYFESDPITFTSSPINANLSAQLLEQNSQQIIEYSILNPETEEELLTFRLLPQGISGPNGGYLGIENFNFEQAVNSSSYIFANNLLGRSRVVQGGNAGLGSVLLQNKFEQNVSTPVPEPGTILGTLVTLAIGTLIKRIKQH